MLGVAQQLQPTLTLNYLRLITTEGKLAVSPADTTLNMADGGNDSKQV